MRRLALVVPVLLTLLVLAPRAQAASGNPLSGKQLFMDCSSGHIAGNRPYSAWWNVYTHKGAQKSLIEKIARVPATKWYAGVDNLHDLGRQLERFFAGVDHPLYGGSDCSSGLHYSAKQWKAGPVPASQRNRYVGEVPVIAVRASRHEDAEIRVLAPVRAHVQVAGSARQVPERHRRRLRAIVLRRHLAELAERVPEIPAAADTLLLFQEERPARRFVVRRTE